MIEEYFRIVEVGARDGLQNESQVVPTATKLELIARLGASGLKTIEATSFVSAKWVPQLADADELYRAMERLPDVRYPVLVPNEKGMQRALAAGVQEIAVFTAASESFNQKNINCSIAESLARFEPVMALAREHKVAVRGYVSCVLGCPYEGEISVDAVARVARALHDMGCYEVSLGDTIGVGTPLKARRMVERIADEVPVDRLAAHFHDTYGQALANLAACIEVGIRTADASVAGLGGCPYAQGASGNVATEDVAYLLNGLGFDTGIDLVALVDAGRFITGVLGREPASKLGKLSPEAIVRWVSH
jgi:hydroxymethylglutaryl-CoA lyase